MAFGGESEYVVCPYNYRKHNKHVRAALWLVQFCIEELFSNLLIAFLFKSYLRTALGVTTSLTLIGLYKLIKN